MPRKKRIQRPERFYHIVCRGNRREPLFLDMHDFYAMLHILTDVYEKAPYELASYCFMTNHFHLQIRSRNHPISTVMANINKRYANYFNNRYQLSGHVFESRYYDKVIDTNDGMLEVSRYIHLNPVKAKLVSRPEEYFWSSYWFYNQTKFLPPCYVNLPTLLNYFRGTVEEKRERYGKYVEIDDNFERSTYYLLNNNFYLFKEE